MIGDVDVLVADDHPMYREGVAAALHAAAGVRVCAVAATGDEAIALARRLTPGVVLLDVQMPGLGGIEDLARVRAAAPSARLIALSMHDDAHHVVGAVRAGARGYLVKGAGADEIVTAVLAVAEGAAFFAASVAEHVLACCARSGDDATAPFPQLTPREREVLELMARGRATHEIAAATELSPKTVRNLVSSILTKLQVVDRGQAVLLARKAGLGG